MDAHILKVKAIAHITHDVLSIETEKPLNYSFNSGQATELSINKPEWKEEKRPFTFTSIPEENRLEFTIKSYPAHKGVTNELLQLKVGDELIIGDSWGNIEYQGEGVFIAGGAGITPFISILRNLHSQHKIGKNKLLFANSKKEDIILKEELETILGNNFINILSNEKTDKYDYGYITEAYIKSKITDFTSFFYLCGPPPMVEAVEKILMALHVNSACIIKEE